jgi:hypothetical protein
MLSNKKVACAAILALVAVNVSAQGWNPNKVDNYYWWYYPSTDAESEDIRQLPCQHS